MIRNTVQRWQRHLLELCALVLPISSDFSQSNSNVFHHLIPVSGFSSGNPRVKLMGLLNFICYIYGIMGLGCEIYLVGLGRSPNPLIDRRTIASTEYVDSYFFDKESTVLSYLPSSLWERSHLSSYLLVVRNIPVSSLSMRGEMSPVLEFKVFQFDRH